MASIIGNKKFEETLSDGKVVSGYVYFLNKNEDEPLEETANLDVRELQKIHKRDKDILLAAIQSVEHDHSETLNMKQYKEKNLLKEIQQTLEKHSYMERIKTIQANSEEFIMRTFMSLLVTEHDTKSKEDHLRRAFQRHCNVCMDMMVVQQSKIAEDVSKLLSPPGILSYKKKLPSPNTKVRKAYTDLAVYLFKRNVQKVDDLYNVLNESNISYKEGKVVERQLDELKSDVPIDIEKKAIDDESFNPLLLLVTFDSKIAKISATLNEHFY
jgi:hypothetical protein